MYPWIMSPVQASLSIRQTGTIPTDPYLEGFLSMLDVELLTQASHRAVQTTKLGNPFPQNPRLIQQTIYIP